MRLPESQVIHLCSRAVPALRRAVRLGQIGESAEEAPRRPAARRVDPAEDRRRRGSGGERRSRGRVADRIRERAMVASDRERQKRRLPCPPRRPTPTATPTAPPAPTRPASPPIFGLISLPIYLPICLAISLPISLAISANLDFVGIPQIARDIPGLPPLVPPPLLRLEGTRRLGRKGVRRGREGGGKGVRGGRLRGGAS